MHFVGQTNIAKLLIEDGADVNATDQFGLTPLMIAASRNDLEIIKELLRHDARLHVGYIYKNLSILHLDKTKLYNIYTK